MDKNKSIFIAIFFFWISIIISLKKRMTLVKCFGIGMQERRGKEKTYRLAIIA